MDNLLRIASIVNKTPVANPKLCADSMIACIDQVIGKKPDIILFPAYSLCGVSLGNTQTNTTLIKETKKQLQRVYQHINGRIPYVIAGLVTESGSVTAIMRGSDEMMPDMQAMEGMDTEDIISSYIEYVHCPHENFGMPDDLHVIQLDGITIQICNCDTLTPFEGMYRSMQTYARTSDILLASSFSPAMAGSLDTERNIFQSFSKSLGIGICVANGGIGDTSSPYVYKGYTAMFECGETLAFSQSTTDEIITIADFDLDIIKNNKRKRKYEEIPMQGLPSPSLILGQKTDILRNIRKTPYLPADPEEEKAYLHEVFELQVHSLATRLKNTGINQVTIGISGGLDSTLTLLVAAKAMDVLSLPRTNITAITMPGFGTTDRTYSYAIELIEKTGAAFREIPIGDSVTHHFKDIGQDINTHDVTYENAQARERAQILLDVANMTGGLVVGTGDLSEEALGFCTFAGDHIANYNVNVCVTKGMIRKIVDLQSKEGIFANAATAIKEILNTPVSPELLPPDKKGNSGHKTEEILGPYELHDFFTYYFVSCGFSPKKIFGYACKAFGEELEPIFIKEKLKLFFKRFFAAQFKRSCAPDSASITNFNLMGNNLYIPSDCRPDLFVREVEAIEI